MPRLALSRDLPVDPRRGLLALRERSERHPMAMFFIIVAVTFAAAAMLSPSRASLPGSPGLSGSTASGKTSRLAAASEADIACRGQAWGAESEACLQVIAREAGRGEGVRIRLVAADTPETTAPNVF
jgi:hypothetical protein